jgi:hypothetical protein
VSVGTVRTMVTWAKPQLPRFPKNRESRVFGRFHDHMMMQMLAHNEFVKIDCLAIVWALRAVVGSRSRMEPVQVSGQVPLMAAVRGNIEGLSREWVRAEAGVGKGSPYNHPPSR